MAASKPTSWLSGPSHIVFHLAVILGPELAVWAVSLFTTDLITRRVSPVIALLGIRSLQWFGKSG